MSEIVCEFCTQVIKSKKSGIKDITEKYNAHLKSCTFNPENKNCLICANFWGYMDEDSIMNKEIFLSKHEFICTLKGSISGIYNICNYYLYKEPESPVPKTWLDVYLAGIKSSPCCVARQIIKD